MDSLPIKAFKDEILKAISNNPVTVIVAETGAGKSTQVPKYLLEAGYDLVVTQPRRLAVRTVSVRVAEEIGEEIGETVGYRTAVDRKDSEQTRCLFCTDGLALVRELMGQNKGVLVLDEVHEWNENIEVLVAWVKQQLKTQVNFKVVLMSATLEAERLSKFFDEAPIISVPGRLFPVTEQAPSEYLWQDVSDLVSQGRNVLVFQPGKQEISDLCKHLAEMQIHAEVLPLHGLLTPEEQARCFKHYGRPKVVISTNVAQTSVTIDDIDAVVDSGLERRIELVDGVEGLYLRPISLADSTQRKGRAGRTKEGIYIDHCGAMDRLEFPLAEILRKRLDQTVLRLAIAGFDMEEMEFFHQPSVSDIHNAHQSLIRLGCMTESGDVTRIGRLVNKLPVSVQYARMMVEANQLGVVSDILKVAAIMEAGGITVPPPSRKNPTRPDWRYMVPNEKESDVMGQLAVWQLAKSMTKEEMKEKGISLRKYYRAKEIYQHLKDAVEPFFEIKTTGSRDNIIKAVCAGMVDHLYKNSHGYFCNGDDTERQLGSGSLVRGVEWVVGRPFDLEIPGRYGPFVLNLIEMATKVDPMWLAEVAPQLTEEKLEIKEIFDLEQDIFIEVLIKQIFFNGHLIKEVQLGD